MGTKTQALTNIERAHQARRDQGFKTRSVFEEIILEANEPMTVVEVIEAVMERTGNKFSYEHSRLVLSGLVETGRLSSRIETVTERNIRLGIEGESSLKLARLYWKPNTEVPARTERMLVNGRLYRTSQERYRRKSKKLGKRKVTATDNTNVKAVSGIDALIKELSELAEWKRRALDAESKLEKLYKIVAH